MDRPKQKQLSNKEKQRVQSILGLLGTHYSNEYICYLNHENAWQLLIATILSAQCTDSRVNIVTKELFKKYRSVEAFADAELEQLEKDIHSTGFYHNKAVNIIGCCRMLIEDYGGEVPRELEKLIKLPGVGRKTANVIRGNIFHDESIVVDTHVKRISKKLGLTKEDNPEKIEYELMETLPKGNWILFNIQVIAHGRAICTARNPKCGNCFLYEYCKTRS